MRKINLKTTLLSIAALFIIHVDAQTPDIRINGSPMSIFTSANRYSLVDGSYSACAGGMGDIQLDVSGVPAGYRLKVEAYRTDSLFNVLLSDTLSIVAYHDFAPWSTPRASNPSGTDWQDSVHFFRRCGGIAYDTLGTDTANGSFVVTLGNPRNASGWLNVNGFYTVRVLTISPSGTMTSYSASFILSKNIALAMSIQSGTLNTGLGASGCSSRPVVCKAYCYTPHLNVYTSYIARLLKGNTELDTAHFEQSGGHSSAGQYPTLTLFSADNYTSNGAYSVEYLREFVQPEGYYANYPLGLTGKTPPETKGTWIISTMTSGANPTVVSVSYDAPATSFTSNTSSTYRSICQRSSVVAGDSITPFSITVSQSGGNLASVNASLIRYTDATFTSKIDSFSVDLSDGTFDLRTMSSSYLRSSAHSGYYKLRIVIPGNSSCSLADAISNYYFLWNGIPQGNIELGGTTGGGWDSLGIAGNNCSSIISSYCISGIFLKGISGVTSGSISGLKMKLEKLNASCNPTSTVFDGTSSVYPIWNNNGHISSWETIDNASVLVYCQSVDTDQVNYPLAQNFALQYTLFGGTSKFKLTIYIYNSCLAAPIEQVVYLQRGNGTCKTDGSEETTGIEAIDNQNGIVAYPNPATSTIQIESTNGKAIGSLVVYDNLGRLVFSKENITTDIFSADVSHLSSAVYNYQLKDIAGKVYFYGKFLKQ